MKLSGLRISMKYQRMALIPPLCLLTLVCIWTSTTLAPLNLSHHSFSQEVQCISCTDESAFPVNGAFLSLASLPTTSYIKDVTLLTKTNLLKAEDSSSETSPRTSNTVVSVAGSAVQKRVLKSKGRMAKVNTVDVKHARVDCSPGSIGCLKREPEQTKPPTGTSTAGDDDPSDSGKEDLREVPTSEEPKAKLLVEKPDKRQLQSEEVEQDGKNSVTMEMRTNSTDDLHLQSEQQHQDSKTGGPIVMAEIPPAPLVETQAADLPEPELMFKYDNMSEKDVKAVQEVEKLLRDLRQAALPQPNNESNKSLIIQAKDKPLYMRNGTPQGTPAPDLPSCDGRYIFIYDLPSKFNVDLAGQCNSFMPWLNLCDYFQHDGMGPVVSSDEQNSHGEAVLVPRDSWHLTHQYALELIFHARLRNYECLTTDDSKASLFYIPYYGGMDVLRWHFTDNVTNELRDALTWEVVRWLEAQEAWKRNEGLDHVLVLGKITWDFRRPAEADADQWGSKLLSLPQMFAPAKLLIERNPWESNDIGVPHPTFFHPKSDEEIRTWLSHCEKSERRYLVSFAGMPRPNMLGNVRGHLIQQCLDNPQDCFLLRCEGTLCLRPDSTMDVFLHSHFCMQPPGDSPTRRSVFDSLIGGCIPVLFDPYTAYYQYPWHLPEDPKSFSVYIPTRDVMEGKANIIEILKSISIEERAAIRTRIIQDIIPGLLYSAPGSKHPSFRDAFDISIEAPSAAGHWLSVKISAPSRLLSLQARGGIAEYTHGGGTGCCTGAGFVANIGSLQQFADNEVMRLKRLSH
ncbi:hypothetical protein R1sor_023519 [Riccia sorocarpa]|uniref:Exostosin GT47 domain-containing protein n=1 Tax=Riccia sorocarpa TaxID=122646 RepID=A0ABD3GN00_9MARC